MAELLRCRSCGYVAEASRTGEVCPACGVPRKMMDPWKDPVSERRRLVLWLDVHPIIDHFTVSFAASAFVLSLVVLVLPGFHPQTVRDILLGLTAALPVAVVGSFASGLLDARVRFRRTSTPVLNRKKVLGAALFAFSAGAAAVVILVGPYADWARVTDAVLLAAGVAVSVSLGRLGQGLLPAIFPG